MAIEILTIIATSLTFFSIYFILSLSLNLEYGFSGLPNFGKVFFFSLGAYVAGAFIPRIFQVLFDIQQPICSANAATLRVYIAREEVIFILILFLISLVISVFFGAFVGYILSYPSLKLREDYLAISLLIVAEISRIFVRTEPNIICGSNGIGGIPNPFIWVNDPTTAELLYAVVTVIIAMLSYIYIEKLVNSPYGRVLKSIRDDELTSKILGKLVHKVKGEVLATASALSAIAGCLYAFFIGFVYPDDFIIIWTMYAWLIILLGGLANNKGVILGSIILVIIDRGLRFIISSWFIYSLPFDVSYLRGVIFSLLLIIILLFRPKGILPEKPLKTIAIKIIKMYKDTDKNKNK
jgi:branched-chain amino acid transport system permease protein